MIHLNIDLTRHYRKQVKADDVQDILCNSHHIGHQVLLICISLKENELLILTTRLIANI